MQLSIAILIVAAMFQGMNIIQQATRQYNIKITAL